MLRSMGCWRVPLLWWSKRIRWRLKLKKSEEEVEVVEKKAGECLVEATELVEKMVASKSGARASGGQLRKWLRNCLLELEEVQGRLASTYAMSRQHAQRIESEAR